MDLYLKNEVLNLDEIEAAGEDMTEGWFQLLRVVRKVGSCIIAFVAQIEEFQKMLWEKRKFVTECFYCITVGNIPEEFYQEISACESQWREWRELFRVDELGRDLYSGDPSTAEGRVAFLKAHPTLVVDTRHFDSRFVDRLLSHYRDLDEMTDGLLVHSENWQALHLLYERYLGVVRCVHIDPPYNTQTSGFLYKNNYQHSCWLSMMENRLRATADLLDASGHFLCHIDENEYERLKILLDTMGIGDAGTVVWDKKNPMLGRRGVATQHEYVIWRTDSTDTVYLRNADQLLILEKAREIIAKHGRVTDDAKREFADWVRNHPGLSGGERAYCMLDSEGRVFQSASLAAPEPRTDRKFFVPLVHPVTGKACPVPPNGWSRTPEKMKQLEAEGAILFGADETVQPRRKIILTPVSHRQIPSIIADASRGKSDMDELGLEFPYCHPVTLYANLLGAAASEVGSLVLDYFAGSGTTAHAMIDLNREDGGHRKFILVEMADYFDTVLLPRIKKVTFASEWKEGKPIRMATDTEAKCSPRIVKVIRLESYEDALNNITFDEPSGQRAMKFEDYLLKYMLKWEARNSQTLLDVESLSRPFSYRLHIHRDGEMRVQPVDLAETFNYLIGLAVETLRVYDNDGRRYVVYTGTTRDGRRTAIIWRDTGGWQESDYERDRDFVATNKLSEGAADIFVNGDSLIPRARALDGLFKARMFAPVEA